MLNLLKILPAALFWVAGNAFAAVNIAVIAPREGNFAVFGDELAEGVRIAVDDLNSQGGVNGQKINLVMVDDQCIDALAFFSAQMMAVAKDQKMDLVIGPYCHNKFEEVADIYAQAGILQIVTTAVDRRESEFARNGLIKLIGSAEEQGKAFFEYYHNHWADAHVALVYDGAVRRQVEIAAGIQKEFMDNGRDLFLNSYNLFNYANMGDLAREITGRNQIVYLLGNAEQVAELAREIRDEDRSCILFVNRYQVGSLYDEMLGDLAEGSYLMGLSSLKDDPDFTETLVQLRLKGAEPRGIGVYGYAAAKLWAKLAERTQSFAYSVLGSAAAKYKFKMPWGEVSFKNGNPDISAGYGIYRIQGGEYTQVY